MSIATCGEDRPQSHLQRFKFTFEGEIAIALREQSGVARLTVRDTGTGIPADQIDRLFDRFHRVEGAKGRSFEGSGMAWPWCVSWYRCTKARSRCKVRKALAPLLP